MKQKCSAFATKTSWDVYCFQTHVCLHTSVSKSGPEPWSVWIWLPGVQDLFQFSCAAAPVTRCSRQNVTLFILFILHSFHVSLPRSSASIGSILCSGTRGPDTRPTVASPRAHVGRFWSKSDTHLLAATGLIRTRQSSQLNAQTTINDKSSWKKELNIKNRNSLMAVFWSTWRRVPVHSAFDSTGSPFGYQAVFWGGWNYTHYWLRRIVDIWVICVKLVGCQVGSNYWFDRHSWCSQGHPAVPSIKNHHSICSTGLQTHLRNINCSVRPRISLRCNHSHIFYIIQHHSQYILQEPDSPFIADDTWTKCCATQSLERETIRESEKDKSV